MNRIPEHILTTLDLLRQKSQLRGLKLPGPGQVDFCSNDYLGMARLGGESPKHLPWGSTGSRLLAGNHSVHEDAEVLIANMFHSESALLYANGYMANLGLLGAIATRHDTYLYDEAIHASMREGIRLSHAKAFSFRHQDLDHLAERLQAAEGCVFVLTESLFSMDGDWTDLRAMAELTERHGAFLIVDEAHSTGIVGPGGAGLVVEAGLADKVFARVHTFGKAIGRAGAAVVGAEALKQFLINRSRSFIYTTAPGPREVSDLIWALKEVERRDELREKLWKVVEKFRMAWNKADLPPLPFKPSPIISVVIPGNLRVKAVAAACQSKGFDLRAILAPTVPEGSERIRLVLHAFNSDEDILSLVGFLQSELQKGAGS